MKQQYTLTIYSEDQMGLINKLIVMLNRRKIALISFNISSTEIDNIYRFTIVIEDTLEAIKNLSSQIEKIIEVYKCYYSTNQETVFRQLTLCKILTSITIDNENFYSVLKPYDAKIVEINEVYTVLEITGNEDENNAFITFLKQFGLVEFIKSSRISLIKSGEGFDKVLAEFD